LTSFDRLATAQLRQEQPARTAKKINIEKYLE